MRLNIPILSSVALLATPLWAQTNTFPASGNVGIGTTSPTAKLEVIGGSNAFGLIVEGDGTSANARIALRRANATGVSATGNIDWIGNDNAVGARIGVNDDVAGSMAFKLGGSASANTRLFISSAGNVGIGSSSPGKRLAIYGSDSSNQIGGSLTGIHIINGDASAAGRVTEIAFGGRSETKKPFAAVSAILVADSLFEQAGDLTFSTKDVTTATYPVERMRILGSGNVGIGTTSPNAKLEVAGYERINASISGSILDVMNADGNDGSGLYVKAGGVNSGKYALAIQSAAGTDIMRVLATGNVGIGTTNPTQKLSVNGTIQAKEIVVQTGWSDYVFEDGFKLKALSEVETYVKTEHHLPGVPSAAQVAKEGIPVGEMQSRLLAKVEELTLHLIAQEKQLAAQSTRIEKLEAENTRLRGNP